MTGTFAGVIIQSLFQRNYLIALGFLGPALASAVGTLGLFNKK
jgi:hypothetical protein